LEKSVTMYSTQICGYCSAARNLLNSKGVSFQDIDVLNDADNKTKMIERANGRRTVPQIFIGETHVGGYDDLSALERAGKLDALLK